jgi:hypothetical protein
MLRESAFGLTVLGKGKLGTRSQTKLCANTLDVGNDGLRLKCHNHSFIAG